MYICNQQIEHDQNNRNSFLKNVFFHFLAVLQGMWDLSSVTRAQIHTLVLEVWTVNPWTTREILFKKKKSLFFFFKTDLYIQQYVN